MVKKYKSYSSKTKYYAVKKGRIPGIYNSWAECYAQTHKYSGQEFKTFEDYEEAKAYLNESNYSKNDDNNWKSKFPSYVYMTGYFDNDKQQYGYDGYIYCNEKKYIIKGSDNNANYINMKSIAGHILGCRAAMEKAIELGIKNIDYYYYYDGVKMWATGKWKRNTYGSNSFYEYMQSIKSKIDINFVKIDKIDKKLKKNNFEPEFINSNLGTMPHEQIQNNEKDQEDESYSEKIIQNDNNRIEIKRSENSINEKNYFGIKEKLLRAKKDFSQRLKKFIYNIKVMD